MKNEDLPDLGSLNPRSPALASNDFWVAADKAALGYPALPEPVKFMGPGGPITSAADAVQRLRAELKTCLMAFRAVPAVHRCPPVDGYEGWEVWEVELALTLLPARDRSFSVVDVAVEFCAANPKVLQVISAYPPSQERSLARIDLGIDLNTELSLVASRKAGIPMPEEGTEASLGKIAGALDIDLKTRYKSGLVYEISRSCLTCAILEGGTVRWRLDRPEAPLQVRLDAAKLSVTLAVAPNAGPVHTFAAAIGWSRALWLSASLGSLFDHLRKVFGDLFVKCQPVECRAEWPDLLSRRASVAK